jgi:hypothetical protein
MSPRTPGAGLTNVLDATTDPGADDDATKALDVGSRWTNTATGVTYECTDNTEGAAVWAIGGAPEATQGEAEAGTVVEPRFFTPELVRQAIDALGAPAPSFKMAIGGHLGSAVLPLSRAGIEVAQRAVTLARFQARRGTPETSGTTTVELEVNGSVVAGSTLSWTSADAAYALKSAVISQAVVLGDQVSLRLTGAGVDAEDVYAEAGS